MARIRILQNDEAPPESKAFLENVEKNGAAVLNLYRALAHSPSAFSSFVKLGNGLLTHTELPPKYRELVILRIAILAGSQYEWHQHVPVALEAGVSQEQVDTIHEWAESDHFDKVEKAILRYCDQVTLNVRASDRTFRVLHKHLSDRSIVELTMTIGYWGMIARILEPLEVDMDDTSVSGTQELTGNH